MQILNYIISNPKFHPIFDGLCLQFDDFKKYLCGELQKTNDETICKFINGYIAGKDKNEKCYDAWTDDVEKDIADEFSDVLMKYYVQGHEFCNEVRYVELNPYNFEDYEKAVGTKQRYSMLYGYESYNLLKRRTAFSNYDAVVIDKKGDRVVAKVNMNLFMNAVINQDDYNGSLYKHDIIGAHGCMMFNIAIQFDKLVDVRFDKDGRKVYMFEASAVPFSDAERVFSNFGNGFLSKGLGKGYEFVFNDCN